MSTARVDTSEVSILNRILRPGAATFSPEAARDILALDFDEADKTRMRELSAKARAGTLTAEEDAQAGKLRVWAVNQDNVGGSDAKAWLGKRLWPDHGRGARDPGLRTPRGNPLDPRG
jgi:hypothetical protein